MKKNFVLLLLTSLILTSCATLKLKGEYPDSSHFSKETNMNYEEVWAKVIDYFSITGMPITTIDKTSGLICSRVSFINSYTREVKGKPLDKNAYVVIPTVRSYLGNILEPKAKLTGAWEMTGFWNVRIKTNGDKTIVNINMTDLHCTYNNTSRIPIKSTGIFEKSLLQYLTKE